MAESTSLEKWELDDITEELNLEPRRGRETKRGGGDWGEEVGKWGDWEVGLKGIEAVETEGKLVAD